MMFVVLYGALGATVHAKHLVSCMQPKLAWIEFCFMLALLLCLYCESGDIDLLPFSQAAKCCKAFPVTRMAQCAQARRNKMLERTSFTKSAISPKIVLILVETRECNIAQLLPCQHCPSKQIKSEPLN